MQTIATEQKQAALSQKEIAHIQVLRQIRKGGITTSDQIEQALSNCPFWWRENAGGLLEATLKYGEEMYWTVYETLILCHPQYARWQPWLTATSTPEQSIPQTPRSVGTLLSDVPEREIRWLWDQRLPLGKSMVTLDLAARVTRGLTMPDHSKGLGSSAGVILIAPEDDLSGTVRPRLRRAGADLSRVISLGTIPMTDPATGYTYNRAFSLTQDLQQLEQAVDDVQAKLVIIDPVMALIGGKDAYRDNEIRMLLTPLQMLLEEKQVAGLLVRHLTKGGSNNALYPGSGSITFVALARSAMMVVKDPYDEAKSLLVHVKTNISKLADPMSFSVVSEEPPDDTRPHICWHGTRNYTLQEIFQNAPSSTPSERSKPNTTRDEILRVLEEHAPEALSPRQVADELPDVSFSTIRVTLSRLIKDGEVEQPISGKYGMIQV